MAIITVRADWSCECHDTPSVLVENRTDDTPRWVTPHCQVEGCEWGGEQWACGSLGDVCDNATEHLDRDHPHPEHPVTVWDDSAPF